MSILQEFIRSTLLEMEITHDGAGIVVVRNFDDEWKVLGLLDPGGKGYPSGMDIPKGHAETGEEPMITAFRETEEEAALKEDDLYFRWGLEPLIIDGHLVIYLAETEAEPKLSRNPLTDEYEHDKLEWLSFDEMHDQSIGFLKPAITWAQNKVENPAPIV